MHVRKHKELDERSIAGKGVAKVFNVRLEELHGGGAAGSALQSGEVQQAKKSGPEKSMVANADMCGQITLPQPVEVGHVACVEGAHKLLAHVTVLPVGQVKGSGAGQCSCVRSRLVGSYRRDARNDCRKRLLLRVKEVEFQACNCTVEAVKAQQLLDLPSVNVSQATRGASVPEIYWKNQLEPFLLL